MSSKGGVSHPYGQIWIRPKVGHFYIEIIEDFKAENGGLRQFWGFREKDRF
jgi:hypothetical protein